MAERARVDKVQPIVPHKTRLEKILDTVERVGNKVPHPAVIFLMLIAIVVVLSQILQMLGTGISYEFINSETHKLETATTPAKSLLSADGIRFMYERLIPNFMSFTAVGLMIVAMVGAGVAEEAQRRFDQSLMQRRIATGLVRCSVVITPLSVSQFMALSES